MIFECNKCPKPYLKILEHKKNTKNNQKPIN